MRLLAREDTRLTAGRWIREHVAPGTTIAVPNLTGYPNPVLPLDRGQVALQYAPFAAALAARGVPDPAASYPLRYLGFFDTATPLPDPPPRFVVTVEHPAILRGMNTPPGIVAQLERAGARPVATFTGIDSPPPPGVRWDPIDADYPPIRGAAAVRAPGPNLTVWDTDPPP